MTRAAEFCYIAETKDGIFLRGLDMAMPPARAWWTSNPDEALRLTADYRQRIADRLGSAVGFRKILAG